MRNTVYALARQARRRASSRRFGARARRALPRGRADGARARRCASPSTRGRGLGEHEHAFQRGSGGDRVATVTGDDHSARDRGRASRASAAAHHRLGVGGLPARRAHDAARDRRPDPRHRGQRALVLRRGRRSTTAPPGATRATRSSRRSATTTARRSQFTLRRMGRAVLEARRGGRARPASRCPTATTCCSTCRASAWRTPTRSSTRRPSPTG